MDATAAAILLAARILVLGPDGTRLVSEHKAGIPPGATGLIRETLHEPGFPSAIHAYITPLKPETSLSGNETPAPLRLRIRAEIWADARASESGSRPDEVNLEDVEIPPSGSALIQLSEDLNADRRLLLTLSVAPEPDRQPAVPPAISARPPREVALRVETFRDQGGARDLADQRLLMTLEGKAVAWELSRRNVLPSTGPADPAETGVSLALTPVSVDGGWITVEVGFRVRLRPVPPATEPLSSESKTLRKVPLGIPFEVALPSPSSRNPEGEEKPETYVVVVTPFLPAGAPD
jgi:hypothetical protein